MTTRKTFSLVLHSINLLFPSYLFERIEYIWILPNISYLIESWMKITEADQSRVTAADAV